MKDKIYAAHARGNQSRRELGKVPKARTTVTGAANGLVATERAGERRESACSHVKPFAAKQGLVLAHDHMSPVP